MVKAQALNLLMDFRKCYISVDTPRIDYFDLVLDELSHFSNFIRRTKEVHIAATRIKLFHIGVT